MNRGMNSSDIKRANRGLFLKNIVLGTANSRIELAKLTGLTKMTAGNIAQELISMGVISESGPIYAGAAGPAPQKLILSESAPKIIGIYISRDEIVFSLGSLAADIIYTSSTPLFNENISSISKKLVAGVDSILKKSHEKIVAIGVAMIGPIDAAGAIVNSPNFFGIKNLPIKKILSENFDYPIVIYNDISAAAVAEHLKGKGAFSNFVFIGNSNGLGAGIIHRGELMTSKNSFIGEFGHITIDVNGERCPCGNTGCLELYASHTVLMKRLCAAMGKPIKKEDFSSLCNEKSCDEIFTDIAEKLAAGMLTVTNLLQPEAFILGYDAYYLPDKYIELMQQRTNNISFLKQDKEIIIQKAFLKDKSAVYGSIACVLNEIFNGKILFNN